MDKKFTRGFTLIELLVVIAIIGILASVVLGSLSGARQRAQVAAFKQEVTSLYPALVTACEAGNIANVPAAGTRQQATLQAGSSCGVNGTGTFTVTVAPVNTSGAAVACGTATISATGVAFTANAGQTC